MNVKRIASLALCALMLFASFALAPFAEDNCPAMTTWRTVASLQRSRKRL